MGITLSWDCPTPKHLIILRFWTMLNPNLVFVWKFEILHFWALLSAIIRLLSRDAIIKFLMLNKFNKRTSNPSQPIPEVEQKKSGRIAAK